MRSANAKQRVRAGLWAAAGVGLVAGPAFAFGAIGFGGFHGGAAHGVVAHGNFHLPPPPAIDGPKPMPPFTRPPPPMHFHDGDHHDHFHDHFHNHFHNGFGLGWGWGGWGWGWGDGEEGYQAAEAAPGYAPPEPPRAAEPPPCAELLTWQPKLGRATRQRLCESD